ncbi:hypothetical protein SFR_0558 [Streptomyces sp. FR-008]|nr:hypothetical protein SFR_0558 [Streptomyces sp. FR-008]
MVEARPPAPERRPTGRSPRDAAVPVDEVGVDAGAGADRGAELP